MSDREERFEIKELIRVSCTCASCHTELIFDVTTAKFKGAACPNCGANLYPLAQLLEEYQTFYNRAIESKLDIRLRAEPNTEED